MQLIPNKPWASHEIVLLITGLYLWEQYFDLVLYVQFINFSVMSGWDILSCTSIKCLAQWQNAMPMVRLGLTILCLWAVTCYFQQCCILTSVYEPVKSHLNFRNSKCCSVSNLTHRTLSDYQSLWLVCTYAQVGLSLFWLHIPNCWKSCAAAHICKIKRRIFIFTPEFGRQLVWYCRLRITLSNSLKPDQARH